MESGMRMRLGQAGCLLAPLPPPSLSSPSNRPASPAPLCHPFGVATQGAARRRRRRRPQRRRRGGGSSRDDSAHVTTARGSRIGQPAGGARPLVRVGSRLGPASSASSSPPPLSLPASASAAANMAESHGPAAGVAGRMPTKRRPPASASDPHRFFEDTSAARLTLPGGGGGGGGGSSSTPRTGTASAAGGPFLPDPVSTFAAAYGSSLATHGKELVDRNIDRFIPVTKLKYYFAVDTVYVGKKLGLLLFPFLHEDWQVQYQQDTPVAPRFDVNAPDLYIPAMAFITYILVAGLAMGTHNRFSPDLLGLQASSALAWLIVEVLAILLSLYLVTVNTDLSTIDLVAFSGYKYVGMILGLLAGLLFGKTGYYLLLSWCCLTIVVFMIRTLRLKILSEAAAEGVLVRGTRNQLRMYLTMAVAGLQPLLMYWLTFHLIY